ncbi:MAG: ABC transporter permease [Lachnospiraceae bacterium]|nr:ABC transporter permease [Lachnospiraceae bacterium]
MWKYILKRLGMMVFVVLGVAIVIFSIMYLVPGDPAQIILGTSATPEQLENLRESMGLNQPYIVQLGMFLRDTFIKLDLGTSYMTKTSIAAEIVQRFPRTLTLAVWSMLVSVIIGLPLGIIAAIHQGKWQDNLSILISMLGISIPGFWLALMMVLLFSVKLRWLPAYGIGGWKYYVMPVLANSVGSIAMNARQTRSAMLDVIRSDYITTARAKGVSERNVIYRHALPNALIPIITLLGTGFGSSLGGTVIVESVFVMPGIGNYMTSAITNLDYPVVRGSVVVLAIAFSFIMLAVDLIYAFVDPRIKAEYVGR